MPDVEGSAPDWSRVDPARVREVIRLAELNIQHQAQAAQSIDQRATALLGMSSAAATALAVFAAARWLGGEAAPALSAGCGAAVATWFVASAYAAAAISPRHWRSAGAWPSQLYRWLEARDRTEAELGGEVAEMLDGYLKENHDRNQTAAANLRHSAYAAVFAPALGLAAGAITQGVVWWLAAR